jgi:diketogulonate reductase-like aldo/keto reductase
VLFAATPDQMSANLKAATLPLDDEDMQTLKSAECGNRLLTGQMFLWKDRQDWRDLWDECGVIVR